MIPLRTYNHFVATPMDSTEVESKLTAYGTEFLKGYSESVDKNYAEVRRDIFDVGLSQTYFPLYGRTLREDTILAALFTPHDFYLFFVKGSGPAVMKSLELQDHHSFSREWTFNTPGDKRVALVRGHLHISAEKVLAPTPGFEAANIPGTNFIAFDIEDIKRDAYSHGSNFGNQAGFRAETQLPQILASSQGAARLASFRIRYKALRDSKQSVQARGQNFERLWRDVLEFYGWRPKKIRIHGEENDFTAIYQGLHILGEVRWFSKPMTGGKLREFLGKLDPRPQTIGLFISQSGLDDGAWSVVRRAVNSKTVVVFERAEIESVLLESTDAGPVFDERLRATYDYIFEQGHER
jgi:hypothetical protein